MNDTMTKIFIFAAGAAIGAAAAVRIITPRYEAIIYEKDEEIEATIDAYEEKLAILQDFTVSEDDILEDESEEEETAEVKMATIIDGSGYSKPSLDEYVKRDEVEESVTAEPEERVVENVFDKYKDKPYVISPDEFGDNEDYDIVTLTYYEGDKWLIDETNQPMEDVEENVSWDSLDMIGEYEDDAIHVRNDRLKIDYEILVEPGNYLDVPSEKPHQVND